MQKSQENWKTNIKYEFANKLHGLQITNEMMACDLKCQMWKMSTFTN